jgi:5'-phosphate synthase pdxT subunit
MWVFSESYPKLFKREQIYLHNSRFKIGVLALQGAYEVHSQRLQELGAEARLVRKPEQLDGLDALVIPGGESTTFLKHLERAGFYDKLDLFCRNQPVFGTCAGCILMAKDVEHPPQRSFGVLDIAVERNAYGRQNDSTILSAQTALPGGPLEMVFIRAPRISRIGPGIETLATRDGSPTLVRQGRLLAATFHPELTADTRVHQLFLDIVRETSV